MTRDSWHGKGSVNREDDIPNDCFELLSDDSCVGSGFTICNVDAEAWSEVKIISQKW